MYILEFAQFVVMSNVITGSVPVKLGKHIARLSKTVRADNVLILFSVLSLNPDLACDQPSPLPRFFVKPKLPRNINSIHTPHADKNPVRHDYPTGISVCKQELAE